MTELNPKKYVASAINAVSRVQSIPPGTKGREIRKAAVIGAGLMGSGIAVCFLTAGIPVVLRIDPLFPRSQRCRLRPARCLANSTWSPAVARTEGP